MIRRLLGVALVGAVLLGGAAVARLHWSGLAGIARTLSAERPVAGDCIRTAGEFAEIVACTSAHSAEVVLVLDRADAARQRQAGTLGTLCQQAADGYTGGLRVTAAPDVVGWQQPVVLLQVASTPRIRPPATGPDWRACILEPVDTPSGGYRGDLRSMTTRVPAELATCARQVSNQYGDLAVSCDRPHQSQTFAQQIAWVPADDRRAALHDPDMLASCRAIVATAMDTDDPTAGGKLVVELARTRGTTAVTPTADQDPGSLGIPLDCRVRVIGTATLDGSLTGLGNNPLPLQQ
ncbi:hypothetical protein GIS00_23870 [Nakamurella sp. YIM 132087]|uniref:Uncharacterized protein n=1 Tax=Nakamurella alba TaxID=2665158 RepID=A0A7K1FS64_9ACTN|nr:hypothetical protein [Nakamurella alba]MTD16978.1 hypothetical protein [Nakamurella alba]